MTFNRYILGLLAKDGSKTLLAMIFVLLYLVLVSLFIHSTVFLVNELAA